MQQINITFLLIKHSDVIPETEYVNGEIVNREINNDNKREGDDNMVITDV